jgi:hypothetical protein
VGTLRQWGGSEPLARTTRSAGFQPGHTTGVVPDPVPNPDYITKYSGETRPELWLADYRLVCQLGGTDDDNLIIRNLPCSSPTPLGPGWSICLRGRSPTRTTWSKPSPTTSRARTYALGTHGISEAAASSQESLSGTTSDDSRSSAPSCPTSPTRTSSARSSLAPPAATW